jgi:hypothetical protein
VGSPGTMVGWQEKRPLEAASFFVCQIFAS